MTGGTAQWCREPIAKILSQILPQSGLVLEAANGTEEHSIHFARVMQALLRGASRILPPGGLLCLYGPYRVAGKHTSASNREFDAQLRAMNSEWGVPDLDAMANEARTFNIELARTFQMPANNLVTVFRKS